ncbi:DUF2809 domain-containing protein [Carboxylicivirga caseinilyticus]|uniref:ribosomal maturation YjgA family protein n=1 Tax=Carboxylicivirga caseinilyticus TaxID=3417572 RepID=UPI003D3554BF|nr:DUF2809 domain-containing protein [Marinilabiliaceae bacterium A049]
MYIRSEYITITELIEPYIGDIIWGAMVFCFFGVLFPKLALYKRLLAALIFSYLIEFSQLMKYDWIETLRSYKIIALVIGYDYSTSDLICYSIGIGTAYLINRRILRYIIS